MKHTHIFRIYINSNGFHYKSCQPYPHKYAILESILTTFPIVSELYWFKNEVIAASKKGEREYTGLNTFECYVNGETFELLHDYDKEGIQEIPTDIVLDFIDKSIAFHKLYNSGGIPGIIPESKKDDWVIVPKEYVKEEYWDKNNKDIS